MTKKISLAFRKAGVIRNIIKMQTWRIFSMMQIVKKYVEYI